VAVALKPDLAYGIKAGATLITNLWDISEAAVFAYLDINLEGALETCHCHRILSWRWCPRSLSVATCIKHDSQMHSPGTPFAIKWQPLKDLKTGRDSPCLKASKSKSAVKCWFFSAFKRGFSLEKLASQLMENFKCKPPNDLIEVASFLGGSVWLGYSNRN